MIAMHSANTCSSGHRATERNDCRFVREAGSSRVVPEIHTRYSMFSDRPEGTDPTDADWGLLHALRVRIATGLVACAVC